jgi:hypothetical protein
MYNKTLQTLLAAPAAYAATSAERRNLGQEAAALRRINCLLNSASCTAS